MNFKTGFLATLLLGTMASAAHAAILADFTAGTLTLTAQNEAQIVLTCNVGNVAVNGSSALTPGTVACADVLSLRVNGDALVNNIDLSGMLAAQYTGLTGTNLFGLAGIDHVVGSFAADVVTGGTGNDTIDLGSGNDTNVWNNGDNTDVVLGGDGNDRQIVKRNRLAGELHDNVTQLVSSISLLTQTLPQTYKRDAVEGERRAGRIHELAQTAFAELRSLLRELQPVDAVTISRTGQSFLGLERLREGGLAAALKRLLPSMIPETLQLIMQFENYAAQEISHEEALYRLCQEAVSNVIRHARARTLTVCASVTERIVLLRICDDGRGMGSGKSERPSSPSNDKNMTPGMGMGTMRARMTALGGVLRISALTPHGTQIEAALPRRDRTPLTSLSKSIT